MWARAAVAQALAQADIVRPAAAAAFAEAARPIEEHFGPGGLGGPLSVLGQRRMEAFIRAHWGREVRCLQRLLDISETAGARGEHGEGAHAYLQALHCLTEMGPEYRREAARALRRARSWPSRWTAATPTGQRG